MKIGGGGGGGGGADRSFKEIRGHAHPHSRNYFQNKISLLIRLIKMSIKMFLIQRNYISYITVI